MRRTALSLSVTAAVALLAACGRSPGGRTPIPGDNDPHPGVNKARAAEKLGLRTRAEIIRYGAAHGWFDALTLR